MTAATASTTAPSHSGGLASALHLFEDDTHDIARGAVTELAKNLRQHMSDTIDQALAGDTLPERAEHWHSILTHLGTVPGIEPLDAWRLFTEHPCLFVEEIDAFFTALVVRPAFHWRTLIDIYEAWYRLAVERKVPGVTEHQAAQDVGLLTRTRWLLLSAPYDHRRSQVIAHEDIDAVVEDDLVGRGRQARDEWLAVLAEIDDHPRLAARLPDLEEEVVTATQIRIEKPNRGSNDSPDHDSLDRTYAATIDFAVTRLLLPRFAWTRAYRAVQQTNPHLRWALAEATGLFLTALVSFVLAACGGWTTGYTAAAAAAALGYLNIGIRSFRRPSFGWLWLLRQPASAAVGLLALAAMPANWWWKDAPRGGALLQGPLLMATITLTVIGAGYLTIEVTNHSVHGAKALRRSLAVALSGWLHSLMVTIIAMRCIVPAFTAAPDNDPIRLSCWSTPTGCGPHAVTSWIMILAATAWSFVTGVFLQILWDDQPITAPLTHVTWRHGR